VFLLLMARMAVCVASLARFASTGDGSDLPPADLSRWIITRAPNEDSDRWIAARSVDNQWAVFLRAGHPAARSLKEVEDDRGKLPFGIKPGRAEEGLAGDIYATQVANGWIVGFDAGEFGSGLWWFSSDGKSRYRISNEQVHGFVRTSGGLLALEGLSHMANDRGQIIQVTRGANGRWKSGQFVDLGSCPKAATCEKDGSLIVVTTKRLVRVKLNKQMVVLVDKTFWRKLYPNSVIIDETGCVYVGMRGCVAKVTPTGRGHTISWLVPSP
jgi:hypothetical protein